MREGTGSDDIDELACFEDEQQATSTAVATRQESEASISAATGTRAKVMPWHLEDVVQFLSKDGDSEPVYLWRKPISGQRPCDEPHHPGGQALAPKPQKQRVIFFSCRVGTDIDPARESQELRDSVFDNHRDTVVFEHIARPEIKHLTNELERMRTRDEEVSLIFSGHGDGESGRLYWHGIAGRKQKERQIGGKQLAALIRLNEVVDKIDSFFLNACCTSEAGLQLHRIGVRVVICWRTTVKDATARDFEVRFFTLLCKEPGEHSTCFQKVCNEMYDDLSEARPCLLLANDGRGGHPAMFGWDGEEVVSVAEETLLSPQNVQPEMDDPEQRRAGAGRVCPPDEAAGIEQTGDGEEDEEEEDIEKNWRRPKQDTDFAAHAGRVEKAALKRFNFSLLLHGREIGPSHGLDGRGMMTPDALRAVGIGKYQDLWCTQGRAGKVLEKAQELLRSEGSAAAREQVRLARDDLEESVFYRQVSVCLCLSVSRSLARSLYCTLSRSLSL